MDTPKQQALELIRRMADDVTWDRIEYVMVLNASIERSEREIAEGKCIPHDQVMAEMKQWLASLGHRQPVDTSPTS